MHTLVTFPSYAQCNIECNDGDIRLVNGNSDRDGTVEICFDYLWGLVGTIGWGTTDAAVVCKQLGLYTDGMVCIIVPYNMLLFFIIAPVAIPNAYKPQKTVHINNVYCIGTETMLSLCPYFKLPVTDPSGYTVAGVACPLPDSSIPVTSTSNTPSSGGISAPVSNNSLYLLTGVFSVLVIVGVMSVLWYV